MFLRKLIAAAIILLLIAGVIAVSIISMASESGTADALLEPNDAAVHGS